MLRTPVSLPGNGLLPKGGKEAMHSNEAIHKVIGDAVEKGSGGKITMDIIALVTSQCAIQSGRCDKMQSTLSVDSGDLLIIKQELISPGNPSQYSRTTFSRLGQMEGQENLSK
jgi:hypothetical protein